MDTLTRMSINEANKEEILSFDQVSYFFSQRKGFTKRKKFWALKDVSFNICRGETVGILGHNGAGKSTVLRLLAGIYEPDQGQITNCGVSVSLLSLQAGFVPYLSGRENSILSGLTLGISKKKILEEIEAIHAFSELGDFYDQPLHTYSTGMRARLGFSIAFRVDPDVLLVDEVLGVGDSEFQQKSASKMREKIRGNKTVVLVSHNTHLIRELCQRAVLIENGHSIIQADTETVLKRYLESKNQKAL